jgi:predicted helicase
MSPDNNPLHSIHTFKQLVTYLRKELDWPIESDDFEELTFDYAPEELGLDAATAVKIKEIKQLRPLTSKQPWGVFFVNFEPKHLPVVVLRRILSKLVIKKRQSANKSQQAAWQMHDLLFVSSYGEDAHRDITFAHFSEEHEMGDLPTLRVLGWDDEDTKLKISFVEHELKTKLRWPDDEKDVKAWRSTWASAFKLRPREVITTAKDLATRLAELASSIRKRANNVLAIESAKGPLRKMHAAFKEALIHDLESDDFADMYAQTISYGLLTARVSRPSGLVADNLSDMVPVTNPFLKDLLETFLTIGGRKGKIDFDELGINEVVQLLRDADMEAVLRDFGDKNPEEDPVIHFYELFLKEYDAEKRVKRGVFYTPRPVVSYIVRSVHEMLQKEFGLEDGLADTTTWGELAKRHKRFNIPDGVSPAEPFVQILDPATGTGTFLVEAIGVIHAAMESRWKKQGHMALEFQHLWNQYVPTHLLPRLNGFELMMAPYAIAHMKIGLKLYETGYKFGSDERARIYLTNTLEAPKDFSDRFAFDVPALAHEASAANVIKRKTCLTIVIGNPPYSKNSANREPESEAWVSAYKQAVAGERNVQPLSDDYLKFFGFGQNLISRVGLGILAMITNRGYLVGLIHRGMRKCLIDQFPHISILDLHGDTNVGEICPDGVANENVFEIQQGVAIAVMSSAPEGPKKITIADAWGTQKEKYLRLLSSSAVGASGISVKCKPPLYLIRVEAAATNFDDLGPTIAEIFPVNSGGIKTHRDELVIDFDLASLKARISELISSKAQDGFGEARTLLKKCDIGPLFKKLLYRPFDIRYIFYHGSLIDRPREDVMMHMLQGPNIGIVGVRQVPSGVFNHIFVSKNMTEMKTCSHDRGANLFPLYLYSAHKKQAALGERRVPNISSAFIRRLEAATLLAFCDDEAKKTVNTFGAHEVLHYVYGILHSPYYREKYSRDLSVQFARIPIPRSQAIFSAVAGLGADLVSLHLLDGDYASETLGSLLQSAHEEVGCKGESSPTVLPGYPKYDSGRVWISPVNSFGPVSQHEWEFKVGGYQVCEKWLRSRKDRKLSKADVERYQKIVVALRETIRIMAEIDGRINTLGAWPGAFLVSQADSKKASS